MKRNSMSYPLVSIIIVCYNQAKYLSHAVESALRQTYPALEVIVVDDGSPDAIDVVMARYADNERVQFIRQRNSGPSIARNTGIAAAQGEYLQFLDADDALAPQKIARQVAVLETQPNVGFVYCDFHTILDDGSLSDTHSVDSRRMGRAEPDIFETLWAQPFFPPHTVLVRRDWVLKVGGFNVELGGPQTYGHEDYELWLRLTASGCQVRYLPYRLVFYRDHPSNRSKNAEKMLRTQVAARNEIARLFPEKIGWATHVAIFAHQDWMGERQDEFLAWIDSLHTQIKLKETYIAQLESHIIYEERKAWSKSLLRFPRFVFLRGIGLFKV